jgi:hypothetical protein
MYELKDFISMFRNHCTVRDLRICFFHMPMGESFEIKNSTNISVRVSALPLKIPDTVLSEGRYSRWSSV